MGHPKPGADIEIGNQRRIRAIRKAQTKAPDHEMQQGANQVLTRKKKRINQNGDGEEKRENFEPASSKQQLFSRSNNLRVACFNNLVLSTVSPYKHGCTYDKSKLLDVLRLNVYKKQPSIWPPYQWLSGLLLSIRKERLSKAREKEVVHSRIVQPLLPLGRMTLLSEQAGRGDRLINMNLESGWLTAPFPGGSPAREGLAILTLSPDVCRISGCGPMAKVLPASCRLVVSKWFLGRMVEFFFATSGKEVLGNLQGGRKISSHSVPAVRRNPQQTKGESLLVVALFDFSRLGLVSVSYFSSLAASLSRRV
ncbi:hypothetical protein Syun_001397 [Stephania yunnanensis]|uniref:Uncharacterized protein n=1 Tax=Stephania yunnanensis TaxID=152371 RepID=A0AAP0LDN0_9MAGN